MKSMHLVLPEFELYLGIWTKDMKRNTNLQQPQVAKAIKNLEARNLIKAVKSIAVRSGIFHIKKHL